MPIPGITLRADVGRPLTHNELDANFSNLHGDIRVRETSITALTAEVNSAKANIVSITNISTGHTGSISGINSELSALTGTVSELSDRVTESVGELTDMIGDLDLRVTELENSEPLSEIARLSELVDAYQVRLLELEREEELQDSLKPGTYLGEPQINITRSQEYYNETINSTVTFVVRTRGVPAGVPLLWSITGDVDSDDFQPDTVLSGEITTNPQTLTFEILADELDEPAESMTLVVTGGQAFDFITNTSTVTINSTSQDSISYNRTYLPNSGNFVRWLENSIGEKIFWVDNFDRSLLRITDAEKNSIKTQARALDRSALYAFSLTNSQIDSLIDDIVDTSATVLNTVVTTYLGTSNNAIISTGGLTLEEYMVTAENGQVTIPGIGTFVKTNDTITTDLWTGYYNESTLLADFRTEVERLFANPPLSDAFGNDIVLRNQVKEAVIDLIEFMVDMLLPILEATNSPIDVSSFKKLVTTA